MKPIVNKDRTTQNDMGDSTPPLVVHIIYALGTGGLENGLINILNRAPNNRFRHAIVCLTEADAFAHRLTAPNVPVIELHKKPGHDLGMYWRLWRTLRLLRPAIVHSRNLAALETQALGLLFPRCKRIHGEHGRDISDLDGSNRTYQRLRRWLNPLIHRFIAVSQDLAGWLTQTVGIAEHKVTQIYNGVDSSRFLPQELTSNGDQKTSVRRSPRVWPHGLPADFTRTSDCVVIGTVGRLAKVKNQALLLHALHQVLQRYPNVSSHLRCIIVGDGPERTQLEEIIASLDLQSHVWLAGDCDDIPAWLSCMDIFVLPSLGEGISNTVLEAMASGLPVIATAVGGNPELVEPEVTGLLVPSADVDALGEAIARLMTDPQLRVEMREAALRKIREMFDWDRTVAAYLQVYDEVLSDPRTRLVKDKA